MKMSSACSFIFSKSKSIRKNGKAVASGGTGGGGGGGSSPLKIFWKEIYFSEVLGRKPEIC